MSWAPPPLPPAAPAEPPPPAGPPPGWYPDPGGAGVRWFDGQAWGPRWAPAEAPKPPFPTLRLSDAVRALVILATSLVVGKLVVSAVSGLGWPVLVEALIAGVVGYAPSVIWIVHVWRREGGSVGDVLGLRLRWPDAGWGPLTYLGAIATQIVLAVLISLIGIPFESNVRDTSDTDRTAGYVIGLIVTAVVMAPIIEELVFRAVVLRGLASRLPIPAAVAVQGILFGSAHADPSRGWGNLGLCIALSGVGVILGISAVVFRRIGPTVVAHAILNGVVLALVLSGALDGLPRA